MNVYIDFQEDVTPQGSYLLNELAERIKRDCDLSVQLNKGEAQKGIKDGGLTIGLTLAGLGLSAIGTLISALSYWKSQQPKCSVSVTRGNTKVVIDNIAPNQLQSITAKLESEDPSSDMKVLISGEE